MKSCLYKIASIAAKNKNFVFTILTGSKPLFCAHLSAKQCNERCVDQMTYKILDFRGSVEHSSENHAGSNSIRHSLQHDFGLSPINNRSSNELDWATPPEGIFCQQPDIYRRELPSITDQFSVNIETVDEVRES